MTEIVTVPVIIGACYLVGFVIKLFKNEKLDNFIPGICVILGIILGLISFFTIPNLIPANDWLTASVIGGVSGLASTGVNQVIKKIKSLISGGEG
jgi:hypothetical protein